MSRDARQAVLGRIRDALGEPAEAGVVTRAYRRDGANDVDQGELFARLVADYRAVVHRSEQGSVAAAVSAALNARGARRVAIPAQLPPAWIPAGDFVLVTDDPPLTAAVLDGIDAVVTGCAVAIAETGTIVLDGGPGQGRRALTLLPDIHVCVVEPHLIVATVSQALARLDPHRPTTWISGPSATSDIELRRVEGVHGPRQLDVIIVQPAGVPTTNRSQAPPIP